MGQETAPKDTILLLTTNLAAEDIAREPNQARDILARTGFLSAELLGRVDKIIPLPRLAPAEAMELLHRLLERLGLDYGVHLIVQSASLVALHRQTRDAIERAGGRGILERLRDLLLDDLLDVQADGFDLALVVVEGEGHDERVRVRGTEGRAA